jgi:hypothetical protein
MKTQKTIVFFWTIISFISCSKDSDEPTPAPNSLQGKIIYEYTHDVKVIDLSNMNESIFFSYNAYSTKGWDLSKDGKVRLISEREPGTVRRVTFKLVTVADGSILKEFEYLPPVGTNQNYSGKLSHDTSMVLIDPDFDNGIVIIDTNGEIKYHLQGINDEALTLGDNAHWLPDNSILIEFQDKYILRSSPPYTTLSLVKEMNYEQWGNLATSMDGQRISVYLDKHIHLMNVDGSDLIQVTESSGAENLAEFSPDGQHLLVGTEYVHAPYSSRSNWRLRIIPADGKLYNIDKSPEVIPVIPTNSDSPAQAGGPTFWRP